MATSHPSIAAGVHRFSETGRLRELIHVAGLIIRQRRTLELAYGGYCLVRHPPSPIYPTDDAAALGWILARTGEFVARAALSRRQLEEAYGAAFPLRDLPRDFARALRESVLLRDGCLILGEYGEGARLACLTPRSCVVSDHYCRTPGVRHIHAIEGYRAAGEFLVATGDGTKLLDLWAVRAGEIRFLRRMRSRLAGYTAAVELNGEYYFGSDFSRRPNFITTLTGAKYFFPEQAYLLHVTAFHPLFDRYIVAVNKELDVFGGRRTLSVFDTRARRFVHCDYLRT